MSRVIAVRLSEGEWQAFIGACAKYNLTKQEFLRAMVIDALVDEGYDGLRCRQSEGREGLGEEGPARGAATP
jgi:hypothetical protein